MSRQAGWPEAPRDGWLETAATLQMWSQIVGKVKLALAPAQNHWWHIALYLTARGLTTSTIPDGNGAFQIDFDFIDHTLVIATSGGRREVIPLASRPLSEFYADFMARLAALKIDVKIWPVPVEGIEAVPFTEDHGHSDYRPEVARRMWKIFLIAEMEMKRFSKGFLGKVSPAHVFWGGFDLAMTRFSGRRAPEHPGGIPHLADWVTREAYSHEVWSAGFWPGTAGGFERPAFYAYAYPEPPDFATSRVSPSSATYNSTLREYLLPYDDVRQLSDPAAAVHDFLQTTYAAAAAHWPRADLERNAPTR
jgi:hypothetical protein